ncbi:MAG: DUF4129 domain-containing protein [Chloroflexota bacterium]|nr:DUF4129 domain-containing protein [Chloroflexota bacterium]
MDSTAVFPLARFVDRIVENVETVIVGKRRQAVGPRVNTLQPAASGPTTAPPASPPQMAPREHVATLSPTWSLFLKGILLWLIVLVSLIARLRSRRLHPGDRPGMRRIPVALLAALRRLMLALRRRECRPHDVTHLPRRRLPVPWRAPRQPSGGQVGAQHPREQVLAAYRDILDRASRHGKPRCPSATPHEFSAALTADLPALQDDLERLTTAFVEARYS